MWRVKVKFVIERETKGAVRYMEVDEKGEARDNMHPLAVVGTLYVRKAALDGQIPSTLQVTIEQVRNIETEEGTVVGMQRWGS